jgi:hypothetical protein
MDKGSAPNANLERMRMYNMWWNYTMSNTKATLVFKIRLLGWVGWVWCGGVGWGGGLFGYFCALERKDLKKALYKCRAKPWSGGNPELKGPPWEGGVTKSNLALWEWPPHQLIFRCYIQNYLNLKIPFQKRKYSQRFFNL